MQIPTVYQNSYNAIQGSDRDSALVSKYLEHTMIGDSAADALIESLSDLNQRDVHRFIQAGMDQDTKVLRDAPRELREFFDALEEPPDWLDRDLMLKGSRGFYRNPDMFLLIFAADVIIRGFSTLISKSFITTGRLYSNGERRLKQNILQLVEIMLPGGMDRYGDGWKLSTRIRIVHAQARRLLRLSDEWDIDTYGMPLSAAHMAFASAVFSAMMLRGVSKIGVSLSQEERDGYMHIWRYTAYLFGVPEALMFQNEAQAMELVNAGLACEPPPTDDSILIANALISSVPSVLGIEEAEERRKMRRLGYRISRKLIGNELADQLRFPKHQTFGVLGLIRLENAFGTYMDRFFPNWVGKHRINKFNTMLDASFLNQDGMSYRLADHVYSEYSSPW